MKFDLVAQVLWCSEYAYPYFAIKSCLTNPHMVATELYRHGKKLELYRKNVPEHFSSTQCFNGSYRQIQEKLFACLLNTMFSLYNLSQISGGHLGFMQIVHREK